jgi:hypothetical protein
MPPIGCHVSQPGETWEVSLFVSPTEIIGGEHDGVRVDSLYLLSVIDLLQVFDVVEDSSWQPHRAHELDELGSHISVTGYYAGRRVCLRVLAEAPSRFAPGRYANILERRFTETWPSP